MVPISYSAVILTKNEEHNLQRCIGSLQWCQEIIVLDSGSTDKTRELAITLGAKVFVHIQESPFKIALQRNWALDNCELGGDWIIFLDADETIPDELVIEIEKHCKNASNNINAYELTPKYIFWETWLKRTQGYPNWHPRLIRSGKARFAGGVWEHFESGALVGRIHVPYNHYANSKGFSDWLERHDRYSTWDAENIVNYLENRDSASLNTQRKLQLRLLAARLWGLRPIARFIQMYILRLGFLEGYTALCFCLLYAMYEFMIVIKIIEIKRKKEGLLL